MVNMAETKNLYIMPVRKSDFKVAFSDPRAHYGILKYAIDFPLKGGTTVLAATSGIVVDIKVASKKGGASKKYRNMKYLNYMTLKHRNGEYSQYGHLKHNGALVKLGERVRRGQKIALSGNTGYTTEPHLHFHVSRYVRKRPGWETIKIRFMNKFKILR